MNQYPLWKYLLIAAVVLLGGLFALPNLYGEDPAVQISAGRGAVIDESLEERVLGAMKEANLEPFASEISVGGRLLMRFSSTEVQLKARDRIQEELGGNYVVALSLAPATPDWLIGMGALPMYLGLDLRGGVHFLMEVDMVAAVAQREKNNVADLRSLLRKNKIRYKAVTRQTGEGITVSFRDAALREQAYALVRNDFADLGTEEEEAAGEYRLRLRFTEAAARELKSFALQQNITTLRNRVNELGVAEPVIQQQGDKRIVVQLPGVQDPARAKDILGATATLEFRLVDEEHDLQDALDGRVPVGSRLYRERDGRPVLLKKRVILTGDRITDAASGIEQQSGSPAVFITLDGQGASAMSKRTRGNIGKRMAVVFIENKVSTRIVDGEQLKSTRTIEEVINVAVIRDQLSKRFQI
ncbi:MAG: protein translocase subunit SecD, partial [Gammaproteobacteria bacterium]|nr:protein translocase subunit SecD [Gammaproteobacteria bacterium]